MFSEGCCEVQLQSKGVDECEKNNRLLVKTIHSYRNGLQQVLLWGMEQIKIIGWLLTKYSETNIGHRWQIIWFDSQTL